MVAAGSGVRLGEPIPKALVALSGTSLVRRSVDQLVRAGVEQIVVSVPPAMEQPFSAALDGVEVPVTCVVGGERRQDSVRLGLQALGDLPDATSVLVHDAARPLVPTTVITRVLAALRSGARAVVPALPVLDSIREASALSSVVVDRDRLRAVQTPQGFHLRTLRDAHDHVEGSHLLVTDDAAACEALGVDVTLVEGDRRALKITEPIDMMVAEAILAAEGPV